MQPRTFEELFNPPPYGPVTEEGQWIIFDQNMFGFHVTRGHPRLIICHRVEELLSQQLQSYNL